MKITIDCQPGYATEHDIINVYLRQPAPMGVPWQGALNYEDALWVFNVGPGDQAGLIIDFHRSGRQVIADLYHDQDGNGGIQYAIHGTALSIGEASRYPVLTVVAEGSWWLPDGKPNFNLDLSIDGPVIATNEPYYVPTMKTDGKPDYLVHVRDPDGNGRPNYEWRQVYPPLDEEDGYYHTLVMVNTQDDEPEIHSTLFWPFIGSGLLNFIKEYPIKAHRFSLAPINIDWSAKTFDLLGEFVASRGSPHNYFVYSIRRIEEGQLNTVNFESPFAFYDLGGPNPEFPDLSIRVAYWPKQDLVWDTAIEQVDLTWRHGDSARWEAPNWDYRLGLLGRHEHKGSVAFPEFGLKVTPYEELPTWVTQNSWDYGTFVAREGGEYLTYEHIYEWSTLEGVVVDYLLPADSPERLVEESLTALPNYVRGTYSGDIGAFYQDIRPGLRGEFSPAINAQPRVYMSSVDHKLHLLKANHGVWNIDGLSEIRYANLDGDAYIDQWIYSQRIGSPQTLAIVRRLNTTSEYLLYGDEQEVLIRRSSVQPSLFETLPPTTSEEWRKLTQQLEAAQSKGDAGDLAAMMRQFAGPELRIDQATLDDYRPIGQTGFRFVLNLKPGYQLEGTDLLGLAGRQPGAYTVTYNGIFHIAPLTPPAIDVGLPVARFAPLQHNAVPVQLRNDGGTDVAAAMLELWATPPQGDATLVITQTVALLAQVPITATLQWAPTQAGDWQLAARVLAPDGQLLAQHQGSVSVTQPGSAGAADLLVASNLRSTLPLVVLIALAFSLIAALSLRRYLPHLAAPQVDDAS